MGVGSQISLGEAWGAELTVFICSWAARMSEPRSLMDRKAPHMKLLMTAHSMSVMLSTWTKYPDLAWGSSHNFEGRAWVCARGLDQPIAR